jgi:two-component system, NarL family, response regulator LiaR
MMPEIISSSGTGKKIRILMADDHPLLRKALRDILVQQVDFEIVAEAGDGEEAVRKAGETLPDVVIMDISMPVLNGLEATRQIKTKFPSIAVLVLTVHSDNEHILGILDSGAAGYLTKSVFDNEVVAAIRAVVAGETVLAAPIFQQILKHALRYTSKTLVLDGKEKLTVREMEILKLAAKGISNKEIASTLNLSLRTVKGYMVDVFSKLHVSSRTEAVITGLRAGLLTLDDIE